MLLSPPETAKTPAANEPLLTQHRAPCLYEEPIFAKTEKHVFFKIEPFNIVRTGRAKFYKSKRGRFIRATSREKIREVLKMNTNSDKFSTRKSAFRKVY